MTKKKYDSSEGIWRTIGGRRVFIKTGQSLSDAMKESGKFKKASDVKRSDYQEARTGLEDIRESDKLKTMWQTTETEGKPTPKKILKQTEKVNEIRSELDFRQSGRYDNEVDYSGDILDLKGKHISGEQQLRDIGNKYLGLGYSQKQNLLSERLGQKAENGVRGDIKDFLSGKEDYDGSREDFINDLSNEWGVEKSKVEDILHEENLKHPRNFKNERSKEVQDLMDDLSVDKGFSQDVDINGSVRLYNQSELKKMEEAGIKPMEHSYTGGGWKGINADKNLSTKEQAKAITDEMKRQFPDVKISRKSDNYSMGSSIDFNIMESGQDLFINDKDIDNMTDFGRLSVGIGFENWAEKNVDGFKRYTNETYTLNDVRRYAKEALNNIKSHEDQNVRGDEWYLSDYGKKVVSELNKQADSYTYSDSDGMIDYFDHGTYMHISIGKWNKPYQVSTSKSVKNAYEQYLKEHKGSNMSLEEFKKWFK